MLSVVVGEGTCQENWKHQSSMKEMSCMYRKGYSKDSRKHQNGRIYQTKDENCNFEGHLLDVEIFSLSSFREFCKSSQIALASSGKRDPSNRSAKKTTTTQRLNNINPDQSSNNEKNLATTRTQSNTSVIGFLVRKN